MKLAANFALRSRVTLRAGDGWEPAAAQAFGSVFYSANFFAAYSGDKGGAFSKVSPYTLAQSVGLTFCCDQDVLYLPQTNTLVWILLSSEGPVLMCLASPDELDASKGLAWTVYVLSDETFRRRGDTFDYPKVSFGDNHLYLSFNVIERVEAIVCKFDMAAIRRRGTIGFQFFRAPGDCYLCPCQNTGGAGLFVAQHTTSQLRVWSWSELSNAIQVHDVNVATIPTEDFETPVPEGVAWMGPNSQIDSLVTGAARMRNELWAAWTGGRRVHGREERAFAQPHIEIAVINLSGFKLIRQEYIWNEDFAFAYPALTSNNGPEVAITFMWGGIGRFVQHGVGFLSQPRELMSTTVHNSQGGGGHYLTARMGFPEVDTFVAAGYTLPLDPKQAGGVRVEPRYVTFHR